MRFVKEAIVLTAAYYGRDMSEEVLKMYAEDLEGLPEQKVVEAYKAYRRDPKNRTMPLPAQIRALIEPRVDPEGQAREIAARVGGAVVKFGWSNRGAAKEFIGPIGWEAVERIGGWQYLCENLGVRIDPTSFQAQLREQLKHSITTERKPQPKLVSIESGFSSAAQILSGEVTHER